MLILGVAEEVGAFGGGEGVEDGAEPSPEGVDGAGRVVAQQRLEFAEGEFDRVHVRRIGGQVEDLRTGSGEGLADGGNLVCRQVVHDDDVARLERGCEDALDVSAEGLAVHGAVEQPGSRDAVEPEGGDEGHGFPVPERRRTLHPLAAPGTPVEAGHLSIDARFIDEDQALGINERPGRVPPSPARGNVRPLLLARRQGFF